jgi:hypothetical protein
MFRCNACVVGVILVLAAIAAQPAAATTLYSTGFDASEGYTAGQLIGQNGWYDPYGYQDSSQNATIKVGTAGTLTGQSINRIDLAGADQGAGSISADASHALGSLSHLAAGNVYTLTFDAANNINDTYNYGRYGTDQFGITAGPSGNWASHIMWCGGNDTSTSPNQGWWRFEFYDGTTDHNYTFDRGIGLDEAVKLGVVIDGVNHQVWGEYDFDGAGYVATDKYDITDAGIAAINQVMYRHFGSDGVTFDARTIEIDNIALAGPVPEPGTIILMASGLLSLVAYAWRKRKCLPQ